MSRIYGSYEAVRIAFQALRANAVRGVLTTLGIIIGIVAVVTTMTAANGLANRFRESVSVLGSDVLYVSRMPWVFRGRFFQFRNRPNLTLRESEKLADRLRRGTVVNPTANTQRRVKYRSEELQTTTVIGTTERHVLVSSAVPELGRFLTAHDVRFRRRVCVVGANLKEQLFGRADALNQEITIGRAAFRVVGVMEKQGSADFFGGPDFDSQVFIPVTAFIAAFGGAERDFDIAVKAPPGMALADFEPELVGAMRAVRKLAPREDDDFAVNKMDSLLDAFNQVMGVVLAIGLGITGISLFVGGVGVMNIMFVSVTERTREIGIRKALGARRREILQQFLFEAASICVVGGAIGVVLSFAVAAAIDRFLLPASVSLPIVVVALAVAATTGMAAGLIPAWRASRLDPIAALRYE